MNLTKTCITLGAAGLSASLLWGCGNDAQQTTGQDMKERTSQVIEDTGEAAQEAAERAGEVTREGVEKTGDAIENAGDRIESATD
jgi:outer membrane murein-binding lipoprotein Lpp